MCIAALTIAHNSRSYMNQRGKHGMPESCTLKGWRHWGTCWAPLLFQLPNKEDGFQILKHSTCCSVMRLQMPTVWGGSNISWRASHFWALHAFFYKLDITQLELIHVNILPSSGTVQVDWGWYVNSVVYRFVVNDERTTIEFRVDLKMDNL